MAKMDRLRWIPMIVQAYQAAKSKMNSPLPMMNIPSSQVNSEDNKMVPQVRQQSARPAKKLAENRNTLLRAKKLTSGHVSQTNRLIRELRTANRKLNRLESIQRQLKEMENLFAGLREEIQQTATETPRLGEQKENQSAEPGAEMIANRNYIQ